MTTEEPVATSTTGPLQYVQPGQLVALAAPRLLSTILGSCVAVCLWDADRGAGGLNHYLLPQQPTGVVRSPRYGDVAIPELIARLRALGATGTRLEAKLFGGARVLTAFDSDAAHLGTRNVELALDMLAAAEITVSASDVGGRRGRRVLFDTGTGQAWVRLL